MINILAILKGFMSMDNRDYEGDKSFEKQQNVQPSSSQQVTSTAQNNQSNHPSPISPPNNSAPAGLTAISQASIFRTVFQNFVNNRVPPPAIPPNIQQALFGGLPEINTRIPSLLIPPINPINFPLPPLIPPVNTTTTTSYSTCKHSTTTFDREKCGIQQQQKTSLRIRRSQRP